MFLFRNVNQKGIKALMSRDKKLANELLEDIDSIARYTLDEESLTTIMGLFCRKWEQENSWVKRDDVRNWWQGANPCMSITNNGLERANAILKGDNALW